MSQVTSLRVIKASELGCVLDCNLGTGLNFVGGPATDNTAILNTFLQSATPSNPAHLIMDGATVCSGIVTAQGNVTIEGLGMDTGFFVKAGSNANALTNNTSNTPLVATSPPPARGLNYQLKNFRINGNRGSGAPNGNSTSSDPRGNGHWLPAVLLMSVDHINIENVWVYDAPTYGIEICNSSDIKIRNARVESPSNAGNTDGFHIDGPASDIRISDCYFNCGDDSIALNCPEGFGGNIQRVTIANCVFDRCTSAIRIYTDTSTYFADNVSLSNCTGTFVADTNNYLNAAIVLGLNDNVTGKTADAIRNFVCSNCTFSVDNGSICYIGDNCGVISLNNVTWASPTKVNPFLQFMGNGGVSSLAIINCRIYRNTLGSAAAFGINAVNGPIVIAKLRIAGFDIEDEYGYNNGPVPFFMDTTNFSLYELEIDSLDTLHVTSVVDPSVGWDGINTVRGSGLKALGVEIPDNLMANGSDYLSATSHLPSIKIAGVVKTYTVS